MCRGPADDKFPDVANKFPDVADNFPDVADNFPDAFELVDDGLDEQKPHVALGRGDAPRGRLPAGGQKGATRERRP